MSKTGGQGRAPGEVVDSWSRGDDLQAGRGHADELRREEHDRRGEQRPAGRTKCQAGRASAPLILPRFLARVKLAARAQAGSVRAPACGGDFRALPTFARLVDA